MKIETNYYIGQKVYICIYNEDKNHVEIFDDIIDEIYITENNIRYFMRYCGDSFLQDQVFSLIDENGLIDKIDKYLSISEDDIQL